jgi:hypothetical protein
LTGYIVGDLLLLTHRGNTTPQKYTSNKKKLESTGKQDVKNSHLKFDKEQRCALVIKNKQKINVVQFGNCVEWKACENVAVFCSSNFRKSFVVNSTAKMSTRGKNGARGIICGL